MQSNNYIVIQGWMCNELELSGNELLVFALIYGFSQDGVSKFHGTRKYIAETFNISRPTVDKALQKLLEKQYICKEGFDDFVNPNVYWVNLEDVKKLYMGCKETLHGGCKETLHGGCKETLHNNTNKQITNKKEKVLSKDNTTEPKFEFGKQKPKKQNLFTKCVSLIDDKTNDQELRSLLISWLNMLLEKYKARGKILYANVFKGKLNMLDKFDEADWKEIIEYNLQRGYEGFYPIPTFNNSFKNESGARHVPTMTKEDYIRQEEYLREMDEKGVQVRF